MKNIVIIIALLTALTFGLADVTINKSIKIGDGESKSGGISTVNGSIYVGEECKVTGTCRAVNGKISIGESSRVKRLQTVNGGIYVAEDAHVGSDIETVNGPIQCAKGVYVRGSVQSVNGPIELSGTTVHKDITTYNGNITLTEDSKVERHIIIKKSKGNNNRRKPLYITLAEDSVVEGDIIVETDDFKVIVVLKQDGRVQGQIRGATVERN